MYRGIAKALTHHLQSRVDIGTLAWIALMLFAVLIIGSLVFILVEKYKKANHDVPFKDKINRAQKLLIPAVLIIAIIATIVSIAMYLMSRPEKITGACGFELGWTKDELYFRRGAPDSSEENAVKYKNAWITLKDEKISWIDVNLRAAGLYNCDTVGEIGKYSEEDDILNLYGKPENIQKSEDMLQRIYNYPKYNTAFLLSGGRVDRIEVLDRTYYPNGLFFTPKKPKENSELNQKIIEDSQSQNRTIKKTTVKKKVANNPLEGTDDSLYHCAPGISKKERLRRLALKGKVNQSSAGSYSTGFHGLEYLGINSGTDLLLRCW